MKPSVQPVSGALGARVEGIDLAKPIEPAAFARIESALDEHCMLVFPGQALTPRSFCAFARLWGPPEPHVIDTFHHPDDPNILILSNVTRDGRPIGLADAGTYFHTDYSYLEIPARCTILHAIDVPADKAGTTFANQTRAYDELPRETQARIEGLVARHHYGNRDDLDETSRTVASVLNEAQKRKVTWVHHKLARAHPRTGRKSLYAVSGSSFGIEGMDEEAGRALLEELKRHATQDKYCHTHDYRNGDVVVWDNAQLLHRAPLVDFSRPRTLWRITIRDCEASAMI
jgi:taurine dioxygenase